MSATSAALALVLSAIVAKTRKEKRCRIVASGVYASARARSIMEKARSLSTPKLRRPLEKNSHKFRAREARHGLPGPLRPALYRPCASADRPLPGHHPIRRELDRDPTRRLDQSTPLA